MTDESTQSTAPLWPCPRCQTRIPASSQFCPTCGYQLVAQQGSHSYVSTGTGTPQVPTAPPRAAGWRGWSRNKKLAAAGGAFLAVLIVLGAISGPRRPPTASAPTSTPTIGAAAPVTITPRPTLALTPAPAPSERSDPTSTIDTLWTRSRILDLFASEGFVGEDSPLIDGTPRWLGRGPSAEILEVTGAPNAIQSVTLTQVAGEEAGALAGQFLNTFAGTEARLWFSSELRSYAGVDLDTSQSFGDVTVRLQTLSASDGALVLVTVERD